MFGERSWKKTFFVFSSKTFAIRRDLTLNGEFCLPNSIWLFTQGESPAESSATFGARSPDYLSGARTVLLAHRCRASSTISSRPRTLFCEHTLTI